MTSINKYVEHEVSTITKSITKNFDVKDKKENYKDTDKCNNVNKLNMSDALIQASNGIDVENADIIQQTFLDIPFDEEPEQISVEDMIIDGKMYYVDGNNNVYDPESEENIGKLDVKKGIIIKN